MQITQNDSDDADDMDTQIFSTLKTQMGADHVPHQQLEWVQIFSLPEFWIGTD